MKKALPWILLVVLFISIIGGGMFLAVGNSSGLFGASFRATIVSIHTNNPDHSSYVIQGLPSNGPNHRGLYAFSLDDSINVTWNTTDPEQKQFRVGDTIAVFYSGRSHQEESPAWLPGVRRITLLERAE